MPPRSHEKQFQSMNTFAQSYDCIITLITRKIYYNLLLENCLILFWKTKNKNKTRIPFTQGCFVPSFVIIVPAILERKILTKNINVFRYFVIISPVQRLLSFILIYLNSLPSRMLCVKFDWPSGSGEWGSKLWKINRRSTDTRRSETLTWAERCIVFIEKLNIYDSKMTRDNC